MESGKVVLRRRAIAPKCFLFNHTTAYLYPENVKGNVLGSELYGARVLASTEPGDWVQLHSCIKENNLGIDWVVDHYRRVGLGVATNFIFDDSLDVIKKYPKAKLSVPFYGKEVDKIKQGGLVSDLVEWINDKNQFIGLCRGLEVPVPETDLFDSSKKALDYYPDEYPVFVKGVVSAFGQHVIECGNHDEYVMAVKSITGVLQVQKALPKGTIFCNVQYQISKTEGWHKLIRGPLTQQKMDGSGHSGNIYPALVDQRLVLPYTDRLAKFLFDGGMVGIFSFDVAVTEEDEVFCLKCNPCWNDATYCSVPAERLGIEQWESLSVTTNHTSFLAMNGIKPLEYSPAKKSGIVFINWATIMFGKLDVLVAGKQEERKQIIQDFKSQYC
jgi:hypothetical protein